MSVFLIVCAVISGIALIFLLRWVVLWYWKIHEHIYHLTRIANALEEIARREPK